MFDKTTYRHVATAADQQLAAEFANRPTLVAPAICGDDLAAAALNSTGRVTIGNGATIDFSQKEPARSLTVGASDPARAVVETELEGMSRRAEFLLEQMEFMVDRETGQPHSHLIPEYNRLSQQLQSLQYSAAYQQHVALPALRAKANETRGLEQLQREAAAQDERAQNAVSREFDSIFGRTVIR